MGWPEIVIIIAGAAMLGILLKRLPQTSDFKEENMKNNKSIKKIGNFLSKINLLFWRKKEKDLSHEEMVDKLKKPEDKAFWKENELKELQGVKPNIIASTYFDQAEEAFEKKDYSIAEAMYLQAARENPKNVKIFNRLGVIYLEVKNFQDAVEAFSTALRYDSSIGSRHFNLGVAYLGVGNKERAKKCIKEAIQLCPNNEKYQKVLDDLGK